MKKIIYNKMWKKKCIIVCSLFVIACITVYRKEYGQLRFSHDPGFYENEIVLEILGDKNYDIYYTLDGSEPTVESKKYEEAIVLGDASLNENVYAMRADLSTGCYEELIMENGGEVPGYRVPDYLIDKCSVVRAAAITQEGKVLESIQGSYFVDYQEKNYDDLYIVSIITDPDNLFDSKQGIYVTGEAFEKTAHDIAGYYDNPEIWWWWDANYKKRGREWEREVYIEVWDKERNNLLSQNCGIRIQGNGSRSLLPRTLGATARYEYSGKDVFNCDIFGVGGEPHKFRIFSGGTEFKYKIKDYVVHNLTSELSFSTMEFIPCALFLDGEYWGFYYLVENYDKTYIANHFNVDEDTVIIQEEDTIEEGIEDDKPLYPEMREFISENDMSDEENFHIAEELIDMDSYIDYYASQIYIARYGDWPNGNEAAWRTRGMNKLNTYADGKWRWMLYDVNSAGMTLDCAERDSLTAVRELDSVFGSLYENEEFRNRFYERLSYMANYVYSKEKSDVLIDEYINVYSKPIAASYRRFFGEDFEEELVKNAEDLRLFYQKRRDYINGIIQDYYETMDGDRIWKQ